MGKAAASSAAGVIGFVSATAAQGWLGAVLSLLLVCTVIGAICWVINDQYRPERLALLIKSWRASGSARRSTTPGRR